MCVCVCVAFFALTLCYILCGVFRYVRTMQKYICISLYGLLSALIIECIIRVIILCGYRYVRMSE